MSFVFVPLNIILVVLLTKRLLFLWHYLATAYFVAKIDFYYLGRDSFFFADPFQTQPVVHLSLFFYALVVVFIIIK